MTLVSRRRQIEWLADSKGSQPQYGLAAHLVLLWALYGTPTFILWPAVLAVIGMRLVWLIRDPSRIGGGLELSICIGGVLTGCAAVGVPIAVFGCLGAILFCAATLTLAAQNHESGQAWADACWVPLVLGAVVGILIYSS